MLPRVIAPLVGMVSPAPLVSEMETIPVPALMLVPAFIVMTAGPARRLALTVARSLPPLLAIRLRLPSSVVIDALSSIERPA